ncbi:MAG: hypothetical protein K6G18_00150 [Treponema sp.]|nr:hypothetical protein [Treponema sp.]
MNKNYDDIIQTDWHGSLTHPHMPLSARAKIFMPFAALKGFDELLKKKEEAKDRASHDRLHAQPDAL